MLGREQGRGVKLMEREEEWLAEEMREVESPEEEMLVVELPAVGKLVVELPEEGRQEVELRLVVVWRPAAEML